MNTIKAGLIPVWAGPAKFLLKNLVYKHVLLPNPRLFDKTILGQVSINMPLTGLKAL